MKGAYFALGFLVGAVLLAHLKPANTDSCCVRLANAARDKIASYAGPFSGLVSGALDASGITQHIPSLLDDLGVPKS